MTHSTIFPAMINQAYIGNGVRVDVVKPEEYWRGKEFYDPKTTCILLDEYSQYLLPVRTSFVNGFLNQPGYYAIPGTYGPGGSPFIPVSLPRTAEDKEMYSTKHMTDFENVSNIKELLDKNSEFAQEERRMFLSDQPDDIVKLPIDEMVDSALMIFVKMTINSKSISSKLLENRMGVNYNNNMRLLRNKHEISYNKAQEILGCLDIRVTAIADNDPNIKGIINPMASPIKYDII